METVALTILPLDRTVAVRRGEVLLEALRRAGVEIDAPCNGQGRCGKCNVRVTAGLPPLEGPCEHLTAAETAAGTRLACRVTVQGPMTVVLPADWSLDTRILEGERIRSGRLAPAARVRVVRGSPRLHYEGRADEALVGWRLAFAPRGIAVDLGTTTLVATLMDLVSGQELATAAALNPQTRFGHDVMTRIGHGSTPAGLAELTRCIAGALNELVGRVCRKAGADPLEIVDAVLGGNPTMLQLAGGIDPAPLGRVPFTLGLEGGRSHTAGAFGLALNPRARVYVPPLAHAFVGADISAGLLDVGFFDPRPPLLFVDLGTNGEMALAVDGRRIVTSTAAGPAFEGMGISCGMPAAAGAIETVGSDGRHLSLRTVDDAPARGLCGSGIVDLVACLVEHGAVTPDGRMRNPRREAVPPGPFTERFRLLDGVAAVELADGVRFTQRDVRQFQLANSAVRTGIDLLLAAAGTGPERLAKIVVAGAFGHHLRPGSLRTVGLVPPAFDGEIAFAGNTSRTGCARLLVDAPARRSLERAMRTVAHLDIAAAPDFQERFVRNLAFGAPLP